MTGVYYEERIGNKNCSCANNFVYYGRPCLEMTIPPFHVFVCIENLDS